MKKKPGTGRVKVAEERCLISRKKGGGTIRIEAWEDDRGDIVSYSMAYINHLIFSGDNGRVIGYDNRHNHHHRHYLGKTFPVEDFTSYEDLLIRFENEVRRFVK